MNETFEPRAEPWLRLSEKLVIARRLMMLLGMVVLLVVWVALLVLVTGIPRWIPVLLIVLTLAFAGWGWWLIGRRVRSYGYVERREDLLVTSGILFRRLVVVPYGRLQLVDVVAGPVDRVFGIATVRLHTAAATTDATIPGLTPELAAALRDRLARAGESRGAGM
ncbi:MAG: uncharacterized protein QG597_4179 [Actinomycetota bacterium]|nr:uncharacterized protein [Actinomycetota bacterium]